MKMVSLFVFTLAFIVNSIDCSSESDKNFHDECNSGTSSAPSGNLFLLADCISQIDSTPHCDRRSGPPSPAQKPLTPDRNIKILGYTFEQLGFIRLIPRTNEGLRFEFRKYIFDARMPIRWRTEPKNYSRIPTQEQIVLSAYNGEIFAILTYDGILHAIYKKDRTHSRIKINMNSGAIEHLTQDEIRDCPIGKRYPIFPNNFIKAFGNYDSLNCEKKAIGKRYPGFPSSSTTQHPTDQTSSEEPFIRARSRSPPGKPPSGPVLGYAMEKLGYLRLIPHTNKNREFEFRKYIFTTDKRIRMKIDQASYALQPNQEYIVLSTYIGDVFAILDKSETLCGIYRFDRTHSRIKVNMESGAVENLTPDEIRDCPVGRNRRIFPNSFIKAYGIYDSLQLERNHDGEHNHGYSPPIRQHLLGQIPPQEPEMRSISNHPVGWSPTHKVLGYSLAKLGFIRLIPLTNSNQRFEFRRYIFPDSKPLRLRIGENIYVPVPSEEHIVLSISNGDVFAILEHTGLLRGLYSNSNGHPRMKINMFSGDYTKMTQIEMMECRVGNKYPIFSRWFHQDAAEEDSLQHVYH